MGGKSANIICDDADLGAVVPDVVRGMVTHGQGCGLLTRTLVHASRLDELVGMLAAAQRAKVEGLIETGQREGAKIAYGGGRPSGLTKGFFVEPTLFVDVDNSMTIAQREIFGPVGVVIPFEDDDHAVALANDSLFGLAGGVWARNPVRAYGIAAQLRTGRPSHGTPRKARNSHHRVVRSDAAPSLFAVKLVVEGAYRVSDVAWSIPGGPGGLSVFGDPGSGLGMRCSREPQLACLLA